MLPRLRFHLDTRRRRRAAEIQAALTLLAALCALPVAAAADDELNAAFQPLEWLVGDWEAEFRPLGEHLAAPTMSFSWGDEKRSFLKMTGTTPSPDGGLLPEYESIIVWSSVEARFVFLGAYRASAGRVTEDGWIEILGDGVARLHMNVHFPPGETFSDGSIAGERGRTAQFRRTLRRVGDDALRGSFVVRRGDRWEEPKPGMEPEGGFPWQRVSAASDAAPVATALSPTAPPDWLLDHWQRLAGHWIADNSAYRSDQETTDAYGVEWRLGLGGTSLTGRLFGLEDGAETATFWQFREFWHPGTGRVVAEQFGGGGVYGVGHAERQEDGSMEMAQTFYYPAAGSVARTGHRSSLDGDTHVTESFAIGEDGVWTAQRRYVWIRQAAEPEDGR